MNDNLNKKLDRRIRVELTVWEFYLLSQIACRATGLSKKILKCENLDSKVIEALNTLIGIEIPRIACKVMDQIGIFRISEIFPEINNKKNSKKEN